MKPTVRSGVHAALLPTAPLDGTSSRSGFIR